MASNRFSFSQLLQVKVSPLGLLTAIATLTCILTVTGFLGGVFWAFEVTAHFRVQYFFLLILGGTFYFAIKKHRYAATFTAFAVVNLILILPLYFGCSSEYKGNTRLRALLINVHTSNRLYDKVINYIESISPDFIVLQEVDDEWMEALTKLEKEYPFSKSMPRMDNFGIAMFSRVRFEEAIIKDTGKIQIPSVVARFKIENQIMTLIGTHPVPFVGYKSSKLHKQHLSEIAELVSLQKGLVMVLGDLNTTSWTSYFRDFLDKTGLRDSRKGYGIQPTWPTMLPLLWISIDHCLVSSGITVYDRKTGPNIGSDHYPVIVDFGVSLTEK